MVGRKQALEEAEKILLVRDVIEYVEKDKKG